MKKQTLEYTGYAPFVFDGELLFESRGVETNGKINTRWHDIKVYESASFDYIVHIAYHSTWKGEINHNEVCIRASRQAVEAALTEHDPCAHVRGYPPRKEFATKQEALLRDIKARWQDQIGRMMFENAEFFAKELVK